MDIALKQRAELKRLADRSGRAWSDIKRAAHNFNITETTHLQMQELVAFTKEAAAILETLKVIEPDDSRQGILLPLDGMEPVVGKVVLIPNEPEDALEQEVHSDSNE